MSALERAADAGNLGSASALVRTTLAKNDLSAGTWSAIAKVLRGEDRFFEAVVAYDVALADAPAGEVDLRLAKAYLLGEHLRREQEAAAEYKAVLAIEPGNVVASLNLGNLYEDEGRRTEAAACYQRILPPVDDGASDYFELRCEALGRLCGLASPTTIEDPLIRRIEGVLDTRLLTLPVRANLFFALGGVYDRLGAYERAFAAYDAANKCARRAGAPYDRRRIVDEVNAQVTCSPSHLPRPLQQPAIAPRLVFICGMFRSGSTLVEQVLAAHSAVTAGGELNILNKIAAVDLAPFPQSLRQLSDDHAAMLARDYRAEITRLFPDSGHKIVTDKRPDNFLRIGLIRRLFPEAKIIHTVRNAADTCLSVYFQHIDQQIVGYSSDLDDTVHYYGEYRRMMAHWAKLNAGDIHDFDYDAFVRDPKSVLGALLEFLGLPWEEGCLEFHALKNPVKTASHLQVRRPLYQGSSGRSRNYQRYVAPMLDALKRIDEGKS